MITANSRSISIMIMFAITLHLWWAMMIIIDRSAVNATGVASLYRFIHPTGLLSAMLASVALLALTAILSKKPWTVVLLIPQQVILMMSAAGSIEAMWLGQFADGVLRAHIFIMADQMYSVLAAVGHTVAITFHAIRNLPRR